MSIEITDNQLFEIIGRKEVELFSTGKELDAYRASLENVKGIVAEVETLRAAKPALELSNKQLAEKNVQLDQALTEARKEREAIRTELTQKASSLTEEQIALSEADKNVAILSQTVEDLRKQLTSQPNKKSKK